MKMKQGLKKLSALCLALVMVLGISVPTVANAEEGSNVIDKVEITNVPTAEIGGEATVEGITIPENVGYEITHKAWYEVPREGAHVQLEEDDVFEKGKKYRLQMTIAPKTGFEFSDGYEITVNGETPDEYWGSNPIQVFQNYSFLDKID